MSLRHLLDLSGRGALITGGSRGLGIQLAEALGELGAKVVLTARTGRDLDVAVSHLAGLGIDAHAIAFDLVREDDLTPLVEQALKRLGHVDILINNAGTSWADAAETHPIAGWDKVYDLNLRSTFRLTQVVGALSMIPQRYGRIVNIASIAGLGGNPRGVMKTIAYNASKGAMLTFTKALASEWGEHGITVNAIAPGFFPTKMTDAVFARFGIDAFAGRAPLRRLGGDEDLKGAVALFASDAGSYVTGQVLAVDGGLSAIVG